MSTTSGSLAVMDWAMFCSTRVLPAFGGETIKPRWPLPTGAIRSTVRAVKSSVLPLPRSSVKRSVGNKGVRFSKRILCFLEVGSLKLISSTLSMAK